MPFIAHLSLSAGVPLQADGLDVDAVEAFFARGGRARLLYTIPTFHNPTGVTLSIEKRLRLLELARQYDFAIVADEVYQQLYFGATQPPPYFACVAGAQSTNVITIGSFSKIFGPGLRVGWILSHNLSYLQRIVRLGVVQSAGGASPLCGRLVEESLRSFLLHTHIERLQHEVL